MAVNRPRNSPNGRTLAGQQITTETAAAGQIMEHDKERKSDAAPSDEGLKRRGDNVGQSGRWGRGDPGEKRYGNEERYHSTDHPAGAPAEPPHPEPNADKPNRGPYEGRFAEPGTDGEKHGDDKARYPSGGYGKAGGTIGGDRPDAGDERWKDEAGAGYGEDYGVGRDAEGDDGERSEPKRRPD
jgi:hypothetical protein